MKTFRPCQLHCCCSHCKHTKYFEFNSLASMGDESLHVSNHNVHLFNVGLSCIVLSSQFQSIFEL